MYTVVPRSTLPPVTLYSQLRYFELGPKKFELSYFRWEEKEKEVQYGNRVIIDIKLLQYMYISIQVDCT